jgi:hypothetical protein
VRPEEVSGSSGGGERGGEEARGAQADAATARAQADHRLVRRHGCSAAPVENRLPSRGRIRARVRMESKILVS